MSITYQRNKEIQTLSATVKKSDLAIRFGISKSRVSQICSRKEKTCDIHKIEYYTSCRKCSTFEHKQTLYLKRNPDLRRALKRLSGDERDAETVKKRVKIINRLYKCKLKFSSVRIGELLNRNHSTILHHLKAAA